VALTDDQKAMLRLLAQREEGYDDMAALMGIDIEELRARVKEALAEVEEDGRGEELPSQPEPPTPPPPEAPAPPAPPAQAPPRRPAKRAARPARPALKLPKPKLPGLGAAGDGNRGALIGIGAGAVALVILVIVLIIGGGGGSSGSTASTTEGAEGTTAGESSRLTQAILSPSGGGSASGRALFGRYRKNVLLQVEAEGLDPSPKGENYTIWLYRSPKLVLRIGAVPVGKNGKIAVQFPIPAQVLAYVASGAFDQIDVSLTPEAAYKAELAKAKSEKRLPAYTGESVLRGEITGPAIKKQ
jgi:hypothetical protein